MGTEIERKFLLSGPEWKAGAVGTAYRQGYLSREPGRTVRVRVAGAQAFLTVKGPNKGFTRAEFEYPVPVADAEQMLGLCDGPLVEKIRYKITVGRTLWEVDEFLGQNAGLVVAEVELPAENAPFDRPGWVGAEVTDDPRYANSRLAVHPYLSW